MTIGRPQMRSTDPHPLISRYLEQLRDALIAAKTPEDEVVEITLDIESHFTEAARSGRRLRSVMEALGPIDELVKAYTVALALGVRVESHEPGLEKRGLKSWLKWALDTSMLTAAVALTMLMTALGTTLFVTGLVGMLTAILLPFVPSTFLDPTLRLGLPQVVVFFFSVLSLLVGWLALRLVRVKLRSFDLFVRRLRRSQPEDLPSLESLPNLKGPRPTEPQPPLRSVARPTPERWRK